MLALGLKLAAIPKPGWTWLNEAGVSIGADASSEDAWFALGDIAALVDETLQRDALVEALSAVTGYAGQGIRT